MNKEHITLAGLGHIYASPLPLQIGALYLAVADPEVLPQIELNATYRHSAELMARTMRHLNQLCAMPLEQRIGRLAIYIDGSVWDCNQEENMRMVAKL